MNFMQALCRSYVLTHIEQGLPVSQRFLQVMTGKSLQHCSEIIRHYQEEYTQMKQAQAKTSHPVAVKQRNRDGGYPAWFSQIDPRFCKICGKRLYPKQFGQVGRWEAQSQFLARNSCGAECATAWKKKAQQIRRGRVV